MPPVLRQVGHVHRLGTELKLRIDGIQRGGGFRYHHLLLRYPDFQRDRNCRDAAAVDHRLRRELRESGGIDFHFVVADSELREACRAGRIGRGAARVSRFRAERQGRSR